MLEEAALKQTLKALIRGNTDIALYGPKSCGKTVLAKELLNEVLGEDNYIYIKGTLINGKNSFFYLFNDELKRLLRSLDDSFIERELSDVFQTGNLGQTLDGWVSAFNKLSQKNKALFLRLKRIYVMVDKIQELDFKQNFLLKVYTACKQQLRNLKMSFVFIGMSHPNRVFAEQDPFKFMPSFFVNQPSINKIIKQVLVYGFKDRIKIIYAYRMMVEELQQVLNSAFEPITKNIHTIKAMTQKVVEQTKNYIRSNQQLIRKWLDSEELKKLIRKLVQYGPVATDRFLLESCKEDLGIDELKEGDRYFTHQMYPNLIMSSIYLANGYSEEVDRFRFREYCKSTRKRKRNLRQKMSADTFKKYNKYVNHNTQRIIAISEILESEANTNSFKEKDLEHHTLDYYGCFEYLRTEDKVSYYGQMSKVYGGRVSGDAKESQVRDFFKHIDISIQQFMD